MKIFSNAYLIIGLVICLWFTVATSAGWRAVNLGVLDGIKASRSSGGFGRSFGGSWGGGK